MRFFVSAIFAPTLLLIALSSESSTAFAQSEADEAEARAAFEEGVSASESGDWTAAASAFERAYSRSGRIWLLFNVATARMNQDDLIGAAQTFQRFQRECDAASGEQRDHCDDKREEARRELQRAQSLAPRLHVSADEGDLTIDGEPTTRGEILVNPGQHTLVLRRGGRVVDRATVDVPREAEERVILTAPETQVVEDSRSQEVLSEEERGGTNVGGVLLLAAGGATALAGGALMIFGELDDREVQNAPDGSPWSEYEPTHDRAKRRYRIGGALLGVGVAAAAVGVILVVNSGDDAEEAQSELRVGFGHVTYRARF